jgi:hypothetical protein
LGVRGGLFITAFARVGCRWPVADARSYDGIPIAVDEGYDFVSGPSFTAQIAGEAFWSRNWSGCRDRAVVIAAAAGALVVAVDGGKTDSVVVMVAALAPEMVLLVVKIPADGFFSSEVDRSSEPFDIREDCVATRSFSSKLRSWKQSPEVRVCGIVTGKSIRWEARIGVEADFPFWPAVSGPQ